MATRAIRPTHEIAFDYGERLFYVIIFANFLVGMGTNIPTHPGNLMLVASETLTAIMLIIRRPGAPVLKIYPFLIGVIGSIYAWIIVPNGGPVVPGYVFGTLMFIGLATTVAAKACLARSFGVLPANRGVKVEGPYRFIRHPMYMGYFFNQFGFLLACFSAWNATVYLVGWSLLVLRILEEEKILGEDDAYRAYSAKVRFRLIPGIF